MIPFHCDALLPEAERYSSLKFRRVHAGQWDASDELELAAFLAVVPLRWARWVFQWDRSVQRKAKRVVGQPEYANANLERLDVDTGVRVVVAMREGGWRHGKLPDVVVQALRELRHEGVTASKLAELTGLSVDQVKYATVGRPNHQSVARAMLAIG